jgi:hypothetical protein
MNKLIKKLDKVNINIICYNNLTKKETKTINKRKRILNKIKTKQDKFFANY